MFKIKKVLKQHNFIQMVEIELPIFGGSYAIINGDKAKTGLCLDAANELFKTLKKLA